MNPIRWLQRRHETIPVPPARITVIPPDKPRKPAVVKPPRPTKEK